MQSSECYVYNRSQIIFIINLRFKIYFYIFRDVRSVTITTTTMLTDDTTECIARIGDDNTLSLSFVLLPTLARCSSKGVVAPCNQCIAFHAPSCLGCILSDHTSPRQPRSGQSALDDTCSWSNGLPNIVRGSCVGHAE